MNGRRGAVHVVARWATVAAGGACALAGWFAAGVDGFGSALAGAALVVGFFWSGLIPIFLVDRARVGPGLGLAVLLLTYTLRLAVVVLLLRLLTRADLVHDQWLGATIIVCALSWTAVHTGGTLRAGSGAGAGR
ncbi:MAG: hypothetical protein ICV70_07265 [Jiangellaceae bacterium]|nr:hypothetical protein [Jiangellaceae bacterium]